MEELLAPKSLHVVPPHESTSITVVVVTTGGIRLYLSSVLRMGSIYSTLQQWTLCHVRAPPNISNNVLQSGAPSMSRQEVDACWYDSGRFVAASDGKRIIAATPDDILRPLDSGALVVSESTTALL